MELSPSLQKLFPITFSLLPEAAARAFQSEFENHWGFEKLHFFPMLVREKKFSEQITEVADFEYLVSWLEKQDSATRLSGSHLYMNPTAQVILLTEGAAALGREPGVYVLWRKKDSVCDRKMTKEEALLLDRLRDDQIVHRQELDPDESKLLTALLEEEIVFENPSPVGH